MKVPAESLSGSSVRDKIVTAAEVVRLIRDGDSVVVEGFIGQGFAEELTLELEERFLQTGAPRDLTLVFTAAQGNRQGRGLDQLCYEGLLKRAVGGYWGLSPQAGRNIFFLNMEGISRDQIHDQLLPAAQAQRAFVAPGPGPTYL